MGKTKIKGEDVGDKSLKSIDIDFSAATEKTALVDNDSLVINDSVGNNTKRSKLSSLLAYFNAIYNRKSLLQELSSLTDVIPSGFKGLFAKTSGLFWKNSDNSEKRILTDSDTLDLIPRKTITGVISSAAYFAFAQTDINPGQYSGSFKIRVTGAGGIGHTIYFDIEGDSVNIPYYQGRSQTNSQTAATTGLYYLRFVYPKTAGNGYRAFIEFWTYNTTARTITIEASDLYGLSMLSSFTASTYNSTYQNIQTPAVLYNGFITNGTGTFSISGSSDVTYKMFNNNYLAGETIDANDIVYLDDSNSRWYKVLVNNRLIPMGAVIGICISTYNAGGATVIYKNVYATLQTGFTATLHKDIYASGTLDSATGKFKSDGTITGTPLANKAYIRLGRAAQSSVYIYMDDNKYYFTTGDVVSEIKSLNGFKFDALKLNGLPSTGFAKADTAFTTWSNIPSNVAPVHIYVVEASGLDLSSDLYLLLENDISDSSPIVLLLQPGTYNISSAIDCVSKNLLGIIGLSKHDTFIEVECIQALTGITFLENVTLTTTGAFSGTEFLVSGVDNPNTYIKSVDVKCMDIVHDPYDFVAFQNFKNIENVHILNISGAFNECNNITGVTIANDAIPNGVANNLINSCNRISNVSISHSDENTLFAKCWDIINVSVQLLASVNCIVFNNCDQLDNIYINGSYIAFENCRNINNSVVEGANIAVSSSEQISTVKANGCITIGFSSCLQLTNCKAVLAGEDGFTNCSKLSVCIASENTTYGFNACSGMVNNTAAGSSTNYYNCYADLVGGYAVADTPSGGFNA